MNEGEIPVTTDNPILVGIFDGFSWIRCEGKGSFLNSAAMKSFGDERIGAGENLLVVDLAACTGMDSTFMGTLAGMAARLSALDGGTLQIAEPGERNRRSLEDLGLDFLMEIDPIVAIWRQQMVVVRGDLNAPQTPGAIAQQQRARHVLEAHQHLTELNEKNAREFSSVIRILENDLAAKNPLTAVEEQG